MSDIVDDLLYLSGQDRLKGMYGVEPNSPSLCEILGVASLSIVNLQDDNARLREAIEKAPHGQHCAMIWEIRIGGKHVTECTCWKRDALKEEE